MHCTSKELSLKEKKEKKEEEEETWDLKCLQLTYSSPVGAIGVDFSYSLFKVSEENGNRAIFRFRRAQEAWTSTDLSGSYRHRPSLWALTSAPPAGEMPGNLISPDRPRHPAGTSPEPCCPAAQGPAHFTLNCELPLIGDFTFIFLRVLLWELFCPARTWSIGDGLNWKTCSIQTMGDLLPLKKNRLDL